jgi:methylated-DNA-protein-cysteine methyltransferase-like protein
MASPRQPGPKGEFDRRVRQVISSLRPGEITTYGEIAEEAGYAGAARAVGSLLAHSDGTLAWWRVVTSTGRLVPGFEAEHQRRLEREGVEVRAGRVVPAERRARNGTRRRQQPNRCG